MEQKDLIKEKVQALWDDADISEGSDYDEYGKLIEMCMRELGIRDIDIGIVDGEDYYTYATTLINGYNVMFDLDVGVCGISTIDDLVDTIRDLMQKRDECKKVFGV